MEKKYVYGHCEGCGRDKVEGCEKDCKFYSTPPQKTLEEVIDEMVRDFTQIPPRAKSEVRRRILSIFILGQETVAHDKSMTDVAFAFKAGQETERKISCPPHNMIPFNYVGSWSASVPPPNMKCTKCLMTDRF